MSLSGVKMLQIPPGVLSVELSADSGLCDRGDRAGELTDGTEVLLRDCGGRGGGFGGWARV